MSYCLVGFNWDERTGMVLKLNRVEMFPPSLNDNSYIKPYGETDSFLCWTINYDDDLEQSRRKKMIFCFHRLQRNDRPV